MDVGTRNVIISVTKPYIEDVCIVIKEQQHKGIKNLNIHEGDVFCGNIS